MGILDFEVSFLMLNTPRIHLYVILYTVRNKNITRVLESIFFCLPYGIHLVIQDFHVDSHVGHLIGSGMLQFLC